MSCADRHGSTTIKHFGERSPGRKHTKGGYGQRRWGAHVDEPWRNHIIARTSERRNELTVDGNGLGQSDSKQVA